MLGLLLIAVVVSAVGICLQRFTLRARIRESAVDAYGVPIYPSYTGPAMVTADVDAGHHAGSSGHDSSASGGAGHHG